MGKLYHLNVGCADCSIIQSDNFTFLIDTSGIEKYSKLLPKNKTIKAIFITHQHYDHFDGLAYLQEKNYAIEHLIYSPYERRHGDNSIENEEWKDFNNFKDYFKNNGTKLYMPYRQDDLSKPFWNIDNIKFFIVGPMNHIAQSDTRELHDASLVICARLGDRKCLFTGDASDTSLNNIASNTKTFCDDILHASHHGSINGADLEFIKACNANYTVISTKSGVYSNVPDSNAIQRYNNHTKKKVYRTDIDGTITWTF